MKQQPVLTKKTTVACEGEDPRFGHPRIYINLEVGSKALCPYCSKVFVNILKKSS